MSTDSALDDLIALPRDKAAQLAGVSWGNLSYWDLRGLIRPAIRRRMSVHRSVSLYTFDDLVCLLVVAQMRKRGFSLQHVRRVVDHLSSRGYTTPLTAVEFATLGRREIYFRHADGSWEGDARPDQLVMSETIRLEPIRQMIRDATRRAPRTAGQSSRRRGRHASKATFAGTRVPVDTVVAWLQHGKTDAQVLAAYPDLTEEDINHARAQMASV